MKRTIHVPTLVALLVAAACDPGSDELDREIDVAAEDDDDDADPDADDGLAVPDALQSEVDPAEAFALRFEFDGPCSDLSDRSGKGVLWMDRRGHVRGYVFDDWYPKTNIPISGDVSSNGSFEAIERAPFGECTWTGLVDLKSDIAYGGWDCGHGCAGEWVH